MDAELDTTFVRRVKIIYLLQSGIKMSRRDLARRFGVSVVAISRDVTAIGELVSISSNMGRYGGVFLTEKPARQINLFLSDEEEEYIKRQILNASDHDIPIILSILNKFAKPSRKKGFFSQ